LTGALLDYAHIDDNTDLKLTSINFANINDNRGLSYNGHAIFRDDEVNILKKKGAIELSDEQWRAWRDAGFSGTKLKELMGGEMPDAVKAIFGLAYSDAHLNELVQEICPK